MAEVYSDNSTSKQEATDLVKLELFALTTGVSSTYCSLMILVSQSDGQYELLNVVICWYSQALRFGLQALCP